MELACQKTCFLLLAKDITIQVLEKVISIVAICIATPRKIIEIGARVLQ